MAESCSNDGGDDDDVSGGENKVKVDCEGEDFSNFSWKNDIINKRKSSYQQRQKCQN